MRRLLPLLALLLAGEARAAIALDPTAHPGGVPLFTKLGTFTTTNTTPTFSTGGPTLLVVSYANAPGASPVATLSVAGTGMPPSGSWTKVEALAAFGNSAASEVWYASAAGPITGGSVTLTAGSATQSVTVLYALTGASGVGATSTAQDNGGANVAPIAATLTPRAAGSWIFFSGGIYNTTETPTAFVPAAAVVDATTLSTFWQTHYVTPDATSVTIGTSGPNASFWDAVAVEVLAATTGAAAAPISIPGGVRRRGLFLANAASGGPIAMDAGFPVTATKDDTTQAIGATVNVPSGGRLLVAMSVWINPPSTFPPVPATVTSNSLTWTAVARGNAGTGAPNGGGCEIFTAYSSGALTSERVTSTAAAGLAGNEGLAALAVYSFANAKSAVGATSTFENVTGGNVGQFSIPITLQAANSWALMCLAHETNAVTLTPLANTTTDLSYGGGTSLETLAVGRMTSPSSGSGSVTIGFNQSDNYREMAAVEILKAP